VGIGPQLVTSPQSESYVHTEQVNTSTSLSYKKTSLVTLATKHIILFTYCVEKETVKNIKCV